LKKVFSFSIDESALCIMSEISEKYAVNQIGNIPKSLVYLKTNL